MYHFIVSIYYIVLYCTVSCHSLYQYCILYDMTLYYIVMYHVIVSINIVYYMILHCTVSCHSISQYCILYDII